MTEVKTFQIVVPEGGHPNPKAAVEALKGDLTAHKVDFDATGREPVSVRSQSRLGGLIITARGPKSGMVAQLAERHGFNFKQDLSGIGLQ